MVVGFNHNIRYRGELFHVQTEDSGRSNPHVVTLLYRGGTILGSAKTSYADILTTDQLELVVESIMKEQHKDMMRRLKAGEFDAKIFPGQPPAEAPSSAAQEPAPQAADAAQTGPSPSFEGTAPLKQAAAPVQSDAPVAAPAPIHTVTSEPAPSRPVVAQPVPIKAPAPPSTAAPASNVKRSLDEVILDYLITGEE